MTAACCHPLPLYRPRDPQASDLWRRVDRHFDTFQRIYDERFQTKYGYWRFIIERSVTAFLRCGDLHEDFARVRCGDCHHDMFVTFSCKLLGKLCAAVWACIEAEVRRQLGRDDVVPGMIAAIQTHGELLHWHPHIHTLLTCGAFTAEGESLEVPDLDLDRLGEAWREAVFALYLAEFTQHIPPKGSHLVRYYGWYSNKARGRSVCAAKRCPRWGNSHSLCAASHAANFAARVPKRLGAQAGKGGQLSVLC